MVKGLMRKLLPIVILSAVCAMAADMTITVSQLVSFIQSSAKNRLPDKQVAEYLRHVKLSNKLDDQTIEDLQNQGAGPRTVEALKQLGTSSATLAAAPVTVTAAKVEPPPQAPPPDLQQQGKIIDAARDYAMNYTKQLPNYICLEVWRRYDDRVLTHTAGNESWRLADTINTRLSYFEQKEDYKVVMVNGRSVTDTSLDKLGGAISQGDFGSMLREIFEPDSQARFDWDHWGKLRGRKMYVFSYDIDQPHSKYRIDWEHSQQIFPAYRGLVYIDQDTNMIMRITQEAYDIPSSFPVHAVHETLDYDFQKIGDAEFLVPLKAVVTSRTIQYLSKNELEFRLYQKFGTESTIKFEDTPAPLPEDKDEKPAEKPKKP